MLVTVAVVPAAASAARAPTDVLLGSVTVPFASEANHPVSGVTFVKDKRYTFEISGAGLGEYTTHNDSCAASPGQPCVLRRDAFYCYDSTSDSRCGSGESFAIPGIRMVRGWAGWFGSPTPSYNPEHEYSTTGPFFGGDQTIEFGSFFGQQGNCDGPEEREAICSGEFVVEVWGPDPDPSPGGDDEACSVSASLHAFAAGSGCKLGALKAGQPVSIKSPAAGKVGNITLREVPPETRQLILEILNEQEGERIAAALQAKFKEEPSAKKTYFGCLFFIDEVFDGPQNLGSDSGLDNYEEGTLRKACERLVLRKAPAKVKTGARVAAKGCSAGFIPVFPKGTKVTKKMRNGAVSAARRQFRPSCKVKAGKLTASLEARRKKATLNGLLGKRPGTRFALFTPSGTERSERIGVHWKARKR